MEMTVVTFFHAILLEITKPRKKGKPEKEDGANGADMRAIRRAVLPSRVFVFSGFRDPLPSFQVSRR